MLGWFFFYLLKKNHRPYAEGLWLGFAELP